MFARSFHLLLVMAVAAALTACSSPKPLPQPQIALAPQSPLRSAFEVGMVSSGNTDPGGWASGMWNDDARQMMVSYLRTGNLLSSGAGRYDINITLIRYDLDWGLQVDVSTAIRYQIVSTSDQKVLLEDTIESRHTTDFSEANLAVVRRRLAAQEATGENFKIFLEKLAAAKLPLN